MVIAVGLGLFVLAQTASLIMYVLVWGPGGEAASAHDLQARTQIFSVVSEITFALGSLCVWAGLLVYLRSRPPGKRALVGVALGGASVGVLLSLASFAMLLSPDIAGSFPTVMRWTFTLGGSLETLGWMAFVAAATGILRAAGRRCSAWCGWWSWPSRSSISWSSWQFFGVVAGDAGLMGYVYVVIAPRVVTPLPLVWVCLRLSSLPAVAVAAGEVAAVATPNRALADAVGSYRGAVVARIWLLVIVAVLTLMAALARAPNAIVPLGLIGGFVELMIGLVLTGAAISIAGASADSGRLYGTIAAVASAASLVLSGWSLVLTFGLLGVDENSSFSVISDAMKAQERLPTVITIGQILGLCATLPIIGAVHEGLVHAGDLTVSRSSMTTALVVGLGGLGAVGLRAALNPEHTSLGVLLGLAALALTVAIVILVMYLNYLRRARDVLAGALVERAPEPGR